MSAALFDYLDEVATDLRNGDDGRIGGLSTNQSELNKWVGRDSCQIRQNVRNILL